MVLEALEWGWAAHLPATGMTWRPEVCPFTSAESGAKRAFGYVVGGLLPPVCSSLPPICSVLLP